MLKKFAEDLKEARAKSGVSLQQIHNKTRIDIKFLEALENGNFEVLPEVYLRAFIREFASSVGLDETQTMKKYDAAKAGKNVDENADEIIAEETKKESPKKVYTGTEQQHPANAEETPSKQFSPKMALIVVLIAVLGFAVYYFFFYDSSSEIITEKPYEEIIAEKQQVNKPKTADSVKAEEQNYSVGDSLVLVIKSKDTSWISVKPDKSFNEIDFILNGLNQKVVKAKKEFNITVGNSKSVEFILNNKPLNFYGTYRERKIVKIDSTGLTYLPTYRTEQKKND